MSLLIGAVMFWQKNNSSGKLVGQVPVSCPLATPEPDGDTQTVVFTATQAAAGIVLRAHTYNVFECPTSPSQSVPVIGTPLLEQCNRFWVYEYSGNENARQNAGTSPVFNGEFYISGGELSLQQGRANATGAIDAQKVFFQWLENNNLLQSFVSGKMYYVMSEIDLDFSCSTGLTLPSESSLSLALSASEGSSSQVSSTTSSVSSSQESSVASSITSSVASSVASSVSSSQESSVASSITSSVASSTTSSVASSQMMNNPALISRWSGESNGNDTVDGNNGTLVGSTTYATGQVGQAFSFNGVGDYVEIDNAAANLKLGMHQTIDMWIKPLATTDQSPKWARIIRKGNWGDEQSNYNLQRYRDGYLWFGMYGQDGSICIVYDTSNNNSKAPAGFWTHVAVTYDGSVAKLYVNGMLEVQEACVMTPATSDAPLIIGSNITGIFIDEVEIYNQTLSANDIHILFDGSDIPVPSSSAASSQGSSVASPVVSSQTSNVIYLSTVSPMNLRGAIEVAGTADTILVVDQDVSIHSDLLVPDNVTLRFESTAVLFVDDGKKLTISGSLIAPERQIFAGSGIVLGTAAFGPILPEYWGSMPTSAPTCPNSSVDDVNIANANFYAIGKASILSDSAHEPVEFKKDSYYAIPFMDMGKSAIGARLNYVEWHGDGSVLKACLNERNRRRSSMISFYHINPNQSLTFDGLHFDGSGQIENLLHIVYPAYDPTGSTVTVRNSTFTDALQDGNALASALRITGPFSEILVEDSLFKNLRSSYIQHPKIRGVLVSRYCKWGKAGDPPDCRGWPRSTIIRNSVFEELSFLGANQILTAAQTPATLVECDAIAALLLGLEGTSLTVENSTFKDVCKRSVKSQAEYTRVTGNTFERTRYLYSSPLEVDVQNGEAHILNNQFTYPGNREAPLRIISVNNNASSNTINSEISGNVVNIGNDTIASSSTFVRVRGNGTIHSMNITDNALQTGYIKRFVMLAPALCESTACDYLNSINISGNRIAKVTGPFVYHDYFCPPYDPYRPCYKESNSTWPILSAEINSVTVINNEVIDTTDGCVPPLESRTFPLPLKVSNTIASSNFSSNVGLCD